MFTTALTAAAATDPATKQGEHAERVAAQFEQMFVKTLVSSLRQSASIGGDGMFGGGPGADTYADWFDQNLSEQVTRSSRIGIREQLLADFRRHGELPPLDEATGRARAASRSTDLITARAAGLGGTDVVL